MAQYEIALNTTPISYYSQRGAETFQIGIERPLGGELDWYNLVVDQCETYSGNLKYVNVYTEGTQTRSLQLTNDINCGPLNPVVLISWSDGTYEVGYLGMDGGWHADGLTVVRSQLVSSHMNNWAPSDALMLVGYDWHNQLSPSKSVSLSYTDSNKSAAVTPFFEPGIMMKGLIAEAITTRIMIGSGAIVSYGADLKPSMPRGTPCYVMEGTLGYVLFALRDGGNTVKCPLKTV